MELGTHVKHFRQKIGMTQEELAKKLGVKQYVIAKYEKGVHSPTPERVAQVAKILGVTINDLYGVSSENKAVEKKGSMKRRDVQIQKIFGELSPADQRALLKQAKGIVKKT